MHNPEYVIETEMHNVFLEFKMQKDYLISARRPGFVSIDRKKKSFYLVGFAVLAYYRVK